MITINSKLEEHFSDETDSAKDKKLLKEKRAGFGRAIQFLHQSIEY